LSTQILLVKLGGETEIGTSEFSSSRAKLGISGRPNEGQFRSGGDDGDEVTK
jgi:hypothetical protein